MSTALAQIAAEELDLPLTSVEMESGDTAQTPDEGYTSGSQSIENSGTAIRLACAEARLSGSRKRPSGSNGEPTHSPSAKALSPVLTAVSSAMANSWPASISTAKSPRRPRQSGWESKRSSAARRLGAIFQPKSRAVQPMCRTFASRGWCMAASCGRRAMAPGSTISTMRRRGQFRGTIAVVRDGSFVGVVAEREEQAIKARDALIRAAKWSGGLELPDPARLHEQLMALPIQSSVISEKHAEGSPSRRKPSRRPTPGRISRTPRSVRLVRSPNSRTAS